MRTKIGFFMAWFGFSPLVAWANGHSSTALMNGAVQSLVAAGFALSQDAQAAAKEAPPAPNAKQVDDKIEIKILLEALVANAKTDAKIEDKIIKEIARALEIGVDGSTVTAKAIPVQRTAEGWRNCLVIKTKGQTKILLTEYVKAKYISRSYLIMLDGRLEAVADTKKKDEKTLESWKISIDKPEDRKAIEADLEKLLDFWRQYYRDNLKKPADKPTEKPTEAAKPSPPPGR